MNFEQNNNGQRLEKTKSMELGGNLEGTSIKEVNGRKVVGPDIEAIRTGSRSSLEKTNEVNNQDEFNELPPKEGLTEFEKEGLKETEGWSDEIVENISSLEEARIYQSQGLKECQVDGRPCLVDESIDLNQKDADGITNKKLMKLGLSPVSKNGEKIELHHIGQKDDSPLAQLRQSEHRGLKNDSILHDKTKVSEIDRQEFNKERQDHWKAFGKQLEGGE